MSTSTALRLAHCDVPSDLADEINAEHAAVVSAAFSALDHALRCGDLLIQAKRGCKHGTWSKWLADNFDGCETIARAYMRVARKRPAIEAKRQCDADLTFTKALDYIVPKREKVHTLPTPDEILIQEQEHEENIVQSVRFFDDAMAAAEAFNIAPEVAYEEHYRDDVDVDGKLPPLKEHEREIETWRAKPWYEQARKRVEIKEIAACENANKLAREIFSQLVAALRQVGAHDDLAAELETIRQRIKGVGK